MRGSASCSSNTSTFDARFRSSPQPDEQIFQQLNYTAGSQAGADPPTHCLIRGPATCGSASPALRRRTQCRPRVAPSKTRSTIPAAASGRRGRSTGSSTRVSHDASRCMPPQLPKLITNELVDLPRRENNRAAMHTALRRSATRRPGGERIRAGVGVGPFSPDVFPPVPRRPPPPGPSPFFFPFLVPMRTTERDRKRKTERGRDGGAYPRGVPIRLPHDG
jgi:hypothetical protein